MLSFGMDIGYAAVKVALVDEDGRVTHAAYRLHKGRPAAAARELAAAAAEIAGLPPRGGVPGAVTGSGAAPLVEHGAADAVNEVAALVEGALVLAPDCAAVAEIGGQTAKYAIGFSPEDKSRVQVSINANCSSGTGSFLQEQVSRLGLAIEDYSALAARAVSTPRIAGRCGVFAKTDITHHQQEGVPTPDILRGLAHAVVRNYRGAVMRKLERRTPILFAGGVARNEAIVDALRALLELGPGELKVHEHSAATVAVGAAVLGRQAGLAVDLARLADLPDHLPACGSGERDGLVLPPLASFGRDDAAGKHRVEPRAGTVGTVGTAGTAGPVPCWLGIDVGSTSTNLVLADAEDHVLAFLYLRTAGDPVRAVRDGLRRLGADMGSKVRVCGAATTGSGRQLIGRLVGADLVRDEITAQARAATAIDPEADTVFEIGGQDSKFIALENGAVADFQMNKVCAAGTGSFIEEQAKKLGVALEDFGPLALRSRRPLDLGERCAVFMEAAVAARLARGEPLEDIAAGLCHSVIRNYLNRVVGRRRVGQKILFQGGLGHNQGVVNALRSITGRSITVPPFFSVTGAYGAAILAREDMAARPRATLFKGFAPEPAAIGTEGHAPARPGAVPSDEAAPQGAPGFEPGGFDRRLAELVFEGPEMPLDPGKKTVGIPRALFTFGMFPMFAPFFRALGFNVLLSGPTSEETVRLAQEYSLDETCYPVKLVNGHVAELVARNVDYIFFPDLFTVHHPGSRARQDHGCAYMQLAFRIVSQAMGLADRGIGLLAPTIAFSLGPEFMRATFAKLGRTLGRSEQETGAALQVAMRSYNGFQARLAERAAHTLENVDPDAAAFVLVSKIYGVADPALNLGVPDRLAALGHKVLSFVDMPETDIFARHPNMYWPFGQHILEAALAARRRPGLYAVLLTHHGCGPDTVLSHYVREIMGPKPYLALEVDEHSSPVGVATRVEAFVHSLERRRAPAGARAAARGSTGAPAAPDAAGAPNMPESLAAVPGATLLLPRLHPYAELLRETLAARGVDARLLPPTTRTSVDLGRRHTATNEYYAMTALLGDVLAALDGAPGSASGNPLAVLLPQNQGAEVDGQYARLVRAKLDELGRSDVAVLAPYMEDLAALSDGDARQLFLCLVAGDVILTAPPELRPPLLETALRAARGGALTPGVLDGLAVDAARAHGRDNGARTVFAVGDPLVLYNDLLNDDTFRRLENAGHHVARAPLAEALWLLWSDHLANDRPGDARRLASLLDELAALMGSAARALGDRSPYAPDLAALRATADATVGLYAGAFGRYREARALTPPPHADGLVTVTSMYENTGISLGILHKGFAPPDALPALHLTFDGLDTENDRTRTDSFLHYLRPHRS